MLSNKTNGECIQFYVILRSAICKLIANSILNIKEDSKLLHHIHFGIANLERLLKEPEEEIKGIKKKINK